MILPAFGVISEILACYARRRIFGYDFMVYAMMGIAVIGFLVWGHHMFVSGQSAYASLAFSFLSFVVAVPSAIKVYNWTATLYRGQVGFEAPMLYVLGFIGLFTIGGLTGLGRARGRRSMGRDGARVGTSSPPPRDNFRTPPVVDEEPYRYHAKGEAPHQQLGDQPHRDQGHQT
jgi:Cytochrome C and Quinol oxidase polypeptide I